VDAVTPHWAKHYKMYSYITDELIKVAEGELPVDSNRRGVFGHSMVNDS